MKREVSALVDSLVSPCLVNAARALCLDCYGDAEESRGGDVDELRETIASVSLAVLASNLIRAYGTATYAMELIREERDYREGGAPCLPC